MTAGTAPNERSDVTGSAGSTSSEASYELTPPASVGIEDLFPPDGHRYFTDDKIEALRQAALAGEQVTLSRYTTLALVCDWRNMAAEVERLLAVTDALDHEIRQAMWFSRGAHGGVPFSEKQRWEDGHATCCRSVHDVLNSHRAALGSGQASDE